MSATKRRKRKTTWSVTRIQHPAHPGQTLRITELERGGYLYVVWMDSGRQRMASLGIRRADLGATAREQEREARAIALKIIEERASGAGTPTGTTPAPGEVVTLGALADLYEAHGLHGRTEKYQQEQPVKVRRVVAFLGLERDVRSLCRTDVERYTAARRGDGVRQGTIAGEIAALKIALNWAVDHAREDGTPLIAANPIARVRIAKEPRPRRPVADEARYEALRAVASDLPPAFALALDLVWNTGHRIGAVLALRWRDVIDDPETAAGAARALEPEVAWKPEHFPHGGIRWYEGAGTDNKKYEHVAPINADARAAIDRARPDIAPPDAWVFPADKDASSPVGYHTAKVWMRRAQRAAGVPHLPGGLWHPFRRGWATARKHLPAGDVARAGGWRDEATMRRSYIKTDADTIVAAVNGG